MISGLLQLILLLPQQATPDREPNPLAPSLPRLTKEEIAEIEKVIDRFIDYDIGKLKGEGGKKALADFNKLGPESFFPLLDAFNRTANLEHSCPCVIIARKLATIINSSNDPDLLSFAKENIGLEVKAKRHQGVMRDLQFAVQLRRSAVQRGIATGALPRRPTLVGGSPAAKSLGAMSFDELAAAADKERGDKLKGILIEIEKRNGPKVLDTLALAIAKPESETSELARSLLPKHLSRLKPSDLKAQLKHARAEVRAAAAQVVGTKKLRWGAELIDLLEDKETAVQQAARQALVRLSGEVDYGPSPGADAADRADAIRQWRAWWKSQTK